MSESPRPIEEVKKEFHLLSQKEKEELIGKAGTGVKPRLTAILSLYHVGGCCEDAPVVFESKSSITSTQDEVAEPYISLKIKVTRELQPLNLGPYAGNPRSAVVIRNLTPLKINTDPKQYSVLLGTPEKVIGEVFPGLPFIGCLWDGLMVYLSDKCPDDFVNIRVTVFPDYFNG